MCSAKHEFNIEIVKAYKEWTHYFITNASYYQVLQYRLPMKIIDQEYILKLILISFKIKFNYFFYII